MREYHASVSEEVQDRIKWNGDPNELTYLKDSANMSFFNRVSMASRFSARSERESVLRGSEASRRTKGRPDI